MEQDPPRREPFPIVTVTLAALNVIVFAVILAAGADPIQPEPDQMFMFGANFGPVTLAGEPWRLFTSMFLHYGIVHLAMNMIGLVDGGRHVERMYGRAGYLALYVFAGLVGSVVSAMAGKAVSAGASGAIFGVFGAFGAFLLMHRDKIDKQQLANQARGLLIFLAFNVWFGLQAKGIDLRAHLGGLVAGFAAGLVVGSVNKRIVKAVLVGVVGSAGVIIASQFVPRPAELVVLGPTKDALDRFARYEAEALDRYNQLVEADKADLEMLQAIENDVLPTWRKAKQAAFEVRGVPGDLERNLKLYAETRERAFLEIAEGLRTQEATKMQQGMATMREADTYIDKLKP
jgi:rhomboid protease GluP